MAFSLALLGASTYEVPVATGSYDLLETEILTTSQASITFSSLGDYAADYKHLQIRYAARSARTSSTYTEMIIRFNADSGSNYAYHQLSGNGSSVYSDGSSSQTKIQRILMASATSGTDVFGSAVIDILDPFSANKYTTTRALSGIVSGEIRLSSGLWQNTNALTSMELSEVTGSNLTTGTRISLYGLKAGA